MARNSNEPVNYASPLTEPIEIMCGGTRLKIKDESPFTDRTTGERKISKRAITLQGIGMEIPMKIPARDLVQLYHAINDSDLIKGILRQRMSEETIPEKSI